MIGPDEVQIALEMLNATAQDAWEPVEGEGAEVLQRSVRQARALACVVVAKHLGLIAQIDGMTPADIPGRER